MANLRVLDGNGTAVYIAKTGAGTNVSPYVDPAPPLPSGAATGAKQDTLIAAAQAIQAAAQAIQSAVETLDNIVAGGEAQVDVLTLPVVTIGALPASVNNIGDVDVLTLPALVAGNANIGNVDVASVVMPASLSTGKTMVTTAGTRVVLGASTALTSGVTIKALSANTGVIYVGNNTVAAANGFPLAAGAQVFVEIANLATLFIDSSVTGTEGASWIAS